MAWSLLCDQAGAQLSLSRRNRYLTGIREAILITRCETPIGGTPGPQSR